MKDDIGGIFDNAENVTVAESKESVACPETGKDDNPVICVDYEVEGGALTGYYLLQDGKKDFYKADYLISLVKTGKMSVANLRYNEKTGELVYK